jgi:pantoate--beta-alanine ligase
LTKEQRQDAVCLYRALKVARSTILTEGVRNPGKVIKKIVGIIKSVGSTEIDYVKIVDADTLEDVKKIKGKVLVALAVRIGKARLIDNIILRVKG